MVLTVNETLEFIKETYNVEVDVPVIDEVGGRGLMCFELSIILFLFSNISENVWWGFLLCHAENPQYYCNYGEAGGLLITRASCN